MLIYNFQKEFIGIDEKDLKTLGLKNLEELRTEVTDFADLFLKTPGFIHNFKHVHWIDFITCADSNEESKVIINVKNKNYRCIVQISTAYLVDSPTSKSFIINLQNLRELSHKESEDISGDIIQRESPIAESIFNTPEHSDTFEEEVSQEQEDDYNAPLEISLDDDLILDVEEIDSVEPRSQVVQENFDNGYVYDPTVASKELGLPLDIVEEFIQDFIEQTKEFKDDLYKSVDEDDFDNLKMLSHKLKGVAANLRIEDALEELEALTVANTSSDLNEATERLDTLCKIVAKLSGEEISIEKEIILDLDEEDTIDETLTLDLQEDEISTAVAVEYSKDTLASKIGLDIDSFNELFSDFTRESNTLVKSMTQAVEKEDFSLCSSEAIKLKGMSDNMHITGYENEIETLMHSQDSAELSTALKTVDAILTQLSEQGI